MSSWPQCKHTRTHMAKQTCLRSPTHTHMYSHEHTRTRLSASILARAFVTHELELSPAHHAMWRPVSSTPTPFHLRHLARTRAKSCIMRVLHGRSRAQCVALSSGSGSIACRAAGVVVNGSARLTANFSANSRVCLHSHIHRRVTTAITRFIKHLACL